MNSDSVQRSVAIFRRLSTDIDSAAARDDALGVITRLCLELVESAEEAGVTLVLRDGFRTVGATGALAEQVDSIQYELASGPCVDAAVEERAFVTGDLGTDRRWPEFGARAVAQTGVRSMMALRMFFEDDPGIAAALNLYSQNSNAFSEKDQLAAVAGCAYGAAAITSDRRNSRAMHLERALESNREIGAAVGVLIAQHRVSRDEAFDLLRMASQNSHRKLVDIATDVVDTGALPID